MENNIKIFQLNPDTFEYQDYNPTDENLITQSELDTNFSESIDYIEFYIFDENQNLIYPSETIPLTSYNVKKGDVLLNPSNDLENLGFDTDTYNILYSFYRKRLSSNTSDKYFIKEISSDRTEIRLDSNTILNDLIISSTNEFIQYREDSPYFVDFLLNFGNNKTVISNNLRLDITDSEDPTVLVKLYEPLPEEFGLKDELWVVEEISTPQLYEVEFPFTPIIEDDFEVISGPNFSLDVKNVSNNTTQEFSYNTLITSQLTSSNSELENLLEEKGISVNINYEDFNDFIHFSSVKTRLENFIYKVQLIEGIDTQISNLKSSLSSTNNPVFISEQQSLNNKKSDILKNLDGYERFLYFTSGSQYTYPKSNSTPPYNLYSSTSTEVTDWLEFITPLTEEYDDNNRNQLKYTIPEYLREDSDNQKYDLFIDMIGQHYDSIWVYTKNISNRFSADNRLDYGISKDLVKEAIEDFGVKLYSNNFDINDLYTSFLGITPTGNTFPYPNMTGSLPASNGYEYVDNYITSSNTPIPLNDLDKRIQKRIYHNIPYLLKTKGTVKGLRALITSYGIPNTVLEPFEPVASTISLKENIYPPNPSGSNSQDITLSPLDSIQQPETSSIQNEKYLEVGFSIQNHINEDISSSLGDYNLGDYIGDPREVYSNNRTYPDLDQLRDEFYSTYNKSKRVKDFIRIIKFFDNSLFKMIKDFTPANTSLSAGVIVKQHKLERNRQRPAQTSFTDETLETQVKSKPYNYQLSPLVKPEGGTGGSFEKFNGLDTSNSSSQYGLTNRFGITQSYEETLDGPLGPEVSLIFNQDEFYDGEFSGSVLEITNQNLNPGCGPYKKVPSKPITYKPYIYNTTINSTIDGTVTKNSFNNPQNSPKLGEVWILSELVGDQSIANNIYNIIGLKLSSKDLQGEDISNYLTTNLTSIELKFNNKTFFLSVNNTIQYSNYVQVFINTTQGDYQFTDDNLRRNNGAVVSNITGSDLGERGSKNFRLITRGDFTTDESPNNSQGKFVDGTIGNKIQYIQYYNDSFLLDVQDYFNTGSSNFGVSPSETDGTYTIQQSPNTPLRFQLKIDVSSSDTGIESPKFSGLYHYHPQGDEFTIVGKKYDNNFSIGNLDPFYPKSYPDFNGVNGGGGLDDSIFDLSSTDNIIDSNIYNPGTSNNGGPLLIQSGSADLIFDTSGLEYNINYNNAEYKYRPLSGSSSIPTNVDITGSEYTGSNFPTKDPCMIYDRGDKDGLFIFEFGRAQVSESAFVGPWDQGEDYSLDLTFQITSDPPSFATLEPNMFSIYVATGSVVFNNIPNEDDYILYNKDIWNGGEGTNEYEIPENLSFTTIFNFKFNKAGLNENTTRQTDVFDESTASTDIFIKPMIKSNNGIHYRLFEYQSSFTYDSGEPPTNTDPNDDFTPAGK